MKLIVGLGNPGREYENTRHNIGFKVIDELSEQLQIPLDETKFKGLFGRGTVNGEKILLLKPLTYMNLSGEAVAAIMNFYKIPVDNLIVVYDELDLPVGKIRLRYKGSAGGHNGIKSIIQHLGTQEFNRIRIGIDRPERGTPITNYVLSPFRKEEIPLIQEVVQKSAKACEDWTEKPFLEIMNIYNQ